MKYRRTVLRTIISCCRMNIGIKSKIDLLLFFHLTALLSFPLATSMVEAYKVMFGLISWS